MPAPKQTVNITVSTLNGLLAAQNKKEPKLGLFGHLRALFVSLGGAVTGIIGVLAAILVTKAGASQVIESAASASGLPAVKLPTVSLNDIGMNLPEATQTALASHAITAIGMYKMKVLGPIYTSSTKPGEFAVDMTFKAVGYGINGCAYAASEVTKKSFSAVGSLTYKAAASAAPVFGKVVLGVAGLLPAAVVLTAKAGAFVAKATARKTADVLVYGYQDVAPKARTLVDRGLCKVAEGYVAVKSAAFVPSFASVKANATAFNNYLAASLQPATDAMREVKEGVGIIYNRNCPRRNKV